MNTLNIHSVPVYGAKFSGYSNQKSQTNNLVKNNVQMCVNSNPLQDKNYGVLQTKKMNVSFKGGIPTKPINAVSKKVNNLFNFIRTNDLVVTAPNYENAVDSLKKNVENIKTVIKRVFFVEDKSLDRAIGFRKNLGEKEAINLSETPLVIKDSKNKCGFLKPGESGYLQNGDIVNPSKEEIHILDETEQILPIKDSFTFFVDFDKDVEPKIKEINEKSLAKINLNSQGKKEEKKTMFSDVGGMDSTIKELKKAIVFPMKHPEIKNGKNMRKSVLLYGPPGTGKSYVAEACANETGAWFKKINASQLDSKWVGESEENWTNLFEEARNNQPALIFIDEVDAIAKKRGGADTFGDKTLNTILGLMSDSEKNGDQIYMIAATNKRGALDEAFTRAGRFGFSIEAPAPDLKGTGDILDIYLANEPVDKNFDKQGIVQKLFKEKATGSEIAALAEDARTVAMEREHLYEKMDNDTYTPDDLAALTLKNEDFEEAIKILKSQKKDNSRRPIGFTSELYK